MLIVPSVFSFVEWFSNYAWVSAAIVYSCTDQISEKGATVASRLQTHVAIVAKCGRRSYCNIPPPENFQLCGKVKLQTDF